MDLRWPRRRWAVRYTLTNPHRGVVVDDHVAPARYWTRSGAQDVADREIEEYAKIPALRAAMTIQVVHAGPFNEAAYLAEADAQYLAHVSPEARARFLAERERDR
jgi:hypothetical protein